LHPSDVSALLTLPTTVSATLFPALGLVFFAFLGSGEWSQRNNIHSGIVPEIVVVVVTFVCCMLLVLAMCSGEKDRRGKEPLCGKCSALPKNVDFFVSFLLGSAGRWLFASLEWDHYTHEGDKTAACLVIVYTAVVQWLMLLQVFVLTRIRKHLADFYPKLRGLLFVVNVAFAYYALAGLSLFSSPFLLRF
jgi:hypothetical protein